MILTQSQIALENSLRRILPADIVSLWIPDGYNRAKDIIRGNHGQCYGTHPNVPVLPSLINPSVGWWFGGDDYIEIPNMTISKDSGAITFWVYSVGDFTENYGDRAYVIGEAGLTTHKFLGLKDLGSSGYNLDGETDLNGELFVSADDAVPKGQWNHIEVSFDSGVATSYVNTVQVDQKFGLTNDWTFNRIGLSHATTAFTGLNALLSVSRKPRSVAQVKNFYLQTKGLFAPRG